MNRLFSIVATCALLLGCQYNEKEVVVITTINQFDTPEENEQLGKDLFHYMYRVDLPLKLPDLTDEELESIQWYFLNPDDKPAIFLLSVGEKASKNKARIIDYFNTTVDFQVNKQIEDKQIFKRAIELSLDILSKLDSSDFDFFWDNSSYILKERSTKSLWIESIEGRAKLLSNGGDKILLHKQYYESIPGINETGFYEVCFTNSLDNDVQEFVTFHYENDSLKVAGYAIKESQ